MQKDELRYGRLGDIIQVMISMKASKKGLSLEDIEKEMGCNRRTAERVRDVLMRIFPQIVPLQTINRKKYWGFDEHYTRNITKAFLHFSDDELRELELLSKDHERLGQGEKSSILQNIIDKITILREPSDEDMSDLLVSEGYAIHQYNTQKVDTEILTTIRQALLNKQKLSFVYKDSERIVEPYGLMYHHKSYLIAIDDGYMKSFNLHKMQNLKLLDEKFTPDPNFDLKKYSERSFGVYQEEPKKIKLLFSQDVSEDVLNYHFHPTQKLKKLKDGSIEVSLFAGGELELCWELFKWGTGVTILEPQSLALRYKEMLLNILNK